MQLKGNTTEVELARETLRRIQPMFNELIVGQRAMYNHDYDYTNSLATSILNELAEIRKFVESACNFYEADMENLNRLMD